MQDLVGLHSALTCPLDTALKMLQQVKARKSIVEKHSIEQIKFKVILELLSRLHLISLLPCSHL